MRHLFFDETFDYGKVILLKQNLDLDILNRLSTELLVDADEQIWISIATYDVHITFECRLCLIDFLDVTFVNQCNMNNIHKIISFCYDYLHFNTLHPDIDLYSTSIQFLIYMLKILSYFLIYSSGSSDQIKSHFSCQPTEPTIHRGR